MNYFLRGVFPPLSRSTGHPSRMVQPTDLPGNLPLAFSFRCDSIESWVVTLRGSPMHEWSWEQGRQRVRGTDHWRRREAAAGHQALNYLLANLHLNSRPLAVPSVEFSIHFPDHSSFLDAGSIAALRRVSVLVQAIPEMRIVIGGFSGWPGCPSSSLRLCLRRIAAIRSLLLLKNVDPARIGVGMRGAGWLVVDRLSDEYREGSRHSECRLVIHDPHWTLSRN
jgi:outer membrane protein OmpA-like peptidoglycan-associated protein